MGGVLTLASFLAAYAHPDKPSPILRGAFIYQRLLYEPLGDPPPGAESMTLPEGSDPKSNRQYYDSSRARPIARVATPSSTRLDSHWRASTNRARSDRPTRSSSMRGRRSTRAARSWAL